MVPFSKIMSLPSFIWHVELSSGHGTHIKSLMSQLLCLFLLLVWSGVRVSFHPSRKHHFFAWERGLPFVDLLSLFDLNGLIAQVGSNELAKRLKVELQALSHCY